MITAAELRSFFQENSLTDLGLYLDFYPAIVEKVSDGSEAPADHIQVICPELFGVEVHTQWIPQRGTFAGKGIGFYAVPNKGDRVNITFRNGSIHYPYWEFGGWQKDGIPETANGKPQSIILQSTLGQRLEFEINGEEKKIILHHTDDVKIEMVDESILIKNGNSKMTLDTDGVKIEVNGYSLKELLDELVQAIVDMRIATNLGPQPAINMATFFALINTKIPQILK